MQEVKSALDPLSVRTSNGDRAAVDGDKFMLEWFAVPGMALRPWLALSLGAPNVAGRPVAKPTWISAPWASERLVHIQWFGARTSSSGARPFRSRWTVRKTLPQWS
ncbi:hypothetical protein RJ55_06974 [Drechmeria coniospora]|nr:hypothetical protein RJ55_06974 [Drechmeria coniospora]